MKFILKVLLAISLVSPSFAQIVTPTSVACYTDNLGNIVGVPDPIVQPVLSTNVLTGTLPAGTYYVELAYVGAGGISNPSPEATVVLSAQGSVIVATPALQPSGATGFYNVYIGTTSGGEVLQGATTNWAPFTQSTPLSGGVVPQTSNNSVCSVVFSDQIIPTGTSYSVGLQNKNGTPIAGFPQTWCTYSGPTGTINVSQGFPTGSCGQNGVFYPTPIFANPPNSALQSIAGPLSVKSLIGPIIGAVTWKGLQTFNAGLTSAGPTTLNGTTTIASLSIASATITTAFIQSQSKWYWCDQYNTLLACVNAANATGGVAYIPTGNYSASSTVTVGSATVPVDVLMAPQAKITCTMTNSSACIAVHQGSGVNGLAQSAMFGGGGIAGASIFAGAGAVVSSLLTNADQAGTEQAISLNNLYFQVPASATIAAGGATVYLLGTFSGNYINHLTIDTLTAGVGLLVTSKTGVGTTVDDFLNIVVNCYSTAGCQPVQVITGGTGPIGGLSFFHLDAEHPGNNLPMFELNGNTLTGSSALAGTSIHGLYVESGPTSTGTIGLKIRDAHAVSVFGMSCSGVASGDCINLSQSGANKISNITIHNIYNNGFGNTINDTVNSVTDTRSDIGEYNFKTITSYSAGSTWSPPPITAGTLGTPANGQVNYCSDCTIANPCAGGGNGAIAKRLNSVWVCN